MDDQPPPHSRLRRRTSEVRLLYRVSTEINAAADVSRILEVAMDSMDELFGIRRCDVFLVDAAAGELELRASRGEPPQGRVRVRVGSGIVGAAAAKREIVRLNRAADPLALDSDDGIEGRMAIPMLAKDELVGVLFLQTVSDKVLRKGDESLVTIVANQSAVAIQNASLYQGLQRLNENLEQRVRERTAALEAANRELKETQAQLVQSGKMAALGQLAAGLSHEMNTPLGAMQASLDVADRAIAHIRAAGAVSPAEVGQGKLAKALRAIEDTHRVSREACVRVFSIFRTLRRFARLDESALQWTDVHEGLDEAIDLLAHRLAGRIEVARDYGELPEVLCYAGEINQVFLIVLTNAVESIADAGSIRLCTRPCDGRLEIGIADTGRGIASEHLERVFDPGYTTKGAGVGTGLGLGIAFRIMEKHGGEIRLDSAVGRGTTVTLTLPVSAPTRGD